MSPIANMLVQIKNAQTSQKPSLIVPFSNMKQAIAEVLLREGFITSVDKKKRKSKKTELPVLEISLKYEPRMEAGTNIQFGAIRGINLISKPSRRMYAGSKDLRPIKGGFGVAVLSTSKGIMSGREAKKQNIGGEVIFEIW